MAVTVPSGPEDDSSYGRGGKSQQHHHHQQTNKNNNTVAINIESLRLSLSSFAARVQSRVSVDTLRPLPVFLGLNAGAGFCLSPQAFTPPVKKMDKGTPEKIKSRVKLNFAYFLSNYALLAAMTALVVALMHPGMVFFLAIVYGLWTLHSFLLRNQLVLFGIPVHSLLTVQQRFYFLFSITAVVVVWKCLAPTIMFLAISSLMILSHAFLRDPKNVEASSLGAESDDDEEEVDLEGGGDSGASSTSEVMVERPTKDKMRRSGK